MNAQVTIVVAMDLARLIGAGNDLPWRLPADMRRFRRTTMGKPIVMGRKTHESIGKALDGRLNVVISRDTGYRACGCTVAADFAAAIEACPPGEEIMVIGGASIYALALPATGRIHLTLIRERFEGDTWFPEYDQEAWSTTSREDHAPDERNRHPYSFIVLDRRRGQGDAKI